MVDTEWHDLYPVPVRPVELHELVDLHGAGGEEGIRAADDLRLGPRPTTGLCALDLLGARLGLHAVEGVERRDQRQREAVLDRMAREARQPVIRMNGVHRDFAL